MSDPTSNSQAVPWNQPLFPDRYVWLVLFSALDVLLTFTILWIGGREANPIAEWVLVRLGFAGMTVFKFVIVAFVIVVCEVIGRRDFEAARRFTLYAIGITLAPVCVALVLHVRNAWG